ncbi:MAG: nitroreductase family deazaflavin-dependent oxidoreductase [Acidobacteriota bacterium]|nr:nitroreductase family deazaflavin-dependent oxidoreductase [Acidobacteriota bacterium]MDE3191142.1 nitroreductase family deazaflavin-dependent oxidoreductase [Acidobacteriota bacterium]
MTTLFGQEHVDRYRETDGEEGYVWREGSTVLLLTTYGRKTGKPTTTPLIFDLDDGGNPVVVASKGGAPEHPGWYRNMLENPHVEVQIKGERFHAHPRVAEGEERERLWTQMNRMWRHYDEYQTKTDREIPVVVLER